jgi:hypothetical protein
MTPQQEPPGVRRGSHPRAVRLIFRYDGDKLELVSQEKVEMLVPPSDAVAPAAQARTGFWIDLHDAQNRTLFRRVMHPPARDVEVFSNEPGQTLARKPTPQAKGVFVAVVPDLAEGHAVSLSRGEARPAPGAARAREGGAAVREVARFILNK